MATLRQCRQVCTEMPVLVASPLASTRVVLITAASLTGEHGLSRATLPSDEHPLTDGAQSGIHCVSVGDAFEDPFGGYRFQTQFLDETGHPVKRRDAPVHLLGLGVTMPMALKTTVTRSDWSFSVTMTLANAPDGAVVKRLDIEAAGAGVSLTSADLRTIAVDRIVRYVQQEQVEAAGRHKWDRTVTADPASLSPSERLERVAMAYRLATIMRENATEAVAADLRVSRATAGRLVRRCRDEGLLPPTGTED